MQELFRQALRVRGARTLEVREVARGEDGHGNKGDRPLESLSTCPSWTLILDQMNWRVPLVTRNVRDFAGCGIALLDPLAGA